MIRSEIEYKQAVARLAAERERLAEQHARLRALKLSNAEIKRVTDPIKCFEEQLAEDIESYQRAKRGDLESGVNLRGFGQLLVSLRIAQGISQRELAKRLGVHESQISRDERNEYFGITIDRAAKVLDALRVHLRLSVERESFQGALSA